MKFCELNAEFVGKKKLKVKTSNLIFSKMESFLLCYRNVKLIKGWFFILNTTAVSFNHNENFDYFEFLYDFSNIFQFFSSLVETCSLTNIPSLISTAVNFNTYQDIFHLYRFVSTESLKS